MKPHHWDIFCSVVDNFGDIGVCWRLARRLTTGLAQHVRLWVDDLDSFRRLRAAVDTAQATQHIDGIEVRHWRADFAGIAPADIVVEGFGVRLPDAFLDAMAARRPPPVWINLEYLSAEDWVESHHGLPSPHPRLPLTKYFFFPGFTPATGGVLIEGGLDAARTALQTAPGAVAAFDRALGLQLRGGTACRVSLFGYENAALPALVEAWAADAGGVDCIVPESAVCAQLARIAGARGGAGGTIAIGQLRVHVLPFLDPDAYDRLLWSCDLNFVRGEDSFVRAQLAARPLVWQAYPQADAAHLVKADAFAARYLAAAALPAAPALRALFDAWNRQSPACGGAWPALRAALGPLRTHAEGWERRLVSHGDLGANLAMFCEDRLE
jgi:uncharacterized repeat protein (TIGR03837 family)